VRELINRIRRAVVVQDGWIRPADMELHARKDNSRISKLKKADERIKQQLLLSTLRTCQFNITQTARSLGISRPYVYTLIKKFDIELPRR
jgi:two-component system NtrC family response regulator